jgi:hypothetical protein
VHHESHGRSRRVRSCRSFGSGRGAARAPLRRMLRSPAHHKAGHFRAAAPAGERGSLSSSLRARQSDPRAEFVGIRSDAL